MPQSLANLYIHLIFSTKDRQPTLNEEIRPNLHSYMATVLTNLDSPAIIINSVEEVKKSSSKWLKTQSPEFAHFSWQAGYGGFSVSESNAGQVANYIRKQKEHPSDENLSRGIPRILGEKPDSIRRKISLGLNNLRGNVRS